MKIAIIGAMEEEVKALLDDMEVKESISKANMKFYRGTLLKHEVEVVTCGIGKVNAAICTQIIADDFKPDKIINVGVAGALSEKLVPGDVVIGNSLVQHDMDVSCLGEKVGQIPRLDTFDFKCDEELVLKAKKASENLSTHNTYVGRIVSGDQFIYKLDKIKELSKEFEASACEMEGASIAQAAYLNNIPFVVIRSISDNSITGNCMDYEKFKPIAIKNSIGILKGMLSML